MSWQCPECGSTNDDSNLKCVCGYELDTPHGKSSEPAIDNTLPQMVLASVKNLNEQEVRTFIGKEADYYLKKWQPILEGRGRWAGFNWAAFFLTDVWLAYRKMYKAIFVYYAAKIAGRAFLGAILGKHIESSILEILIGLVAGIVCGVFGNMWYLSRTLKVVNEIRPQGLQEEAYFQSLSKFGGTNIRLSIGLLILVIVFEVLSHLFK
jgi:hypothetical protein